VAGNIKVIGILTSQLRGLRRELRLTLQPSRVARVALTDTTSDDPISALIKLS
jgi:hypothetical protein